MTMPATLDDLLAALRHLRSTLDERLAWTVMNAQPSPDGHVLADRLEDWSVEIAAALGEAEMAGLQARAAVEERVDFDRSGRALGVLHDSVRRSARVFNLRLASFDTYAALRLLALAQDSRDWAAWSGDVSDAIAQCRAPLERLEDGVAQAWVQWAEIACAATCLARPHACEATRTQDGTPTGEGSSDG